MPSVQNTLNERLHPLGFIVHVHHQPHQLMQVFSSLFYSSCPLHMVLSVFFTVRNDEPIMYSRSSLQQSAVLMIMDGYRPENPKVLF